MFRGGFELSTTLGSLSADGWQCVHPAGFWCEVSQHWSLQAVECGQVSVPKWWPLGELMAINIPWSLHHQCPCPHSEPRLCPASLGDPPWPTGTSSPGSRGITAFCWIPVHVKSCVCLPRMESLFSPVLWSSSTQVSLAFKAKCYGGSSSFCQTLRLWGLELSFLCENLWDTVIFQFVCHPSSGYGIWLCHESSPPTISLGLLLCF